MLKVTLCSIAIVASLASNSTFGQPQPDIISNSPNRTPDNQNIVEQLQGTWIVVDVQSCVKGATSIEEIGFGKIIFDFKSTTYTVAQSHEKDETPPDPDELTVFSIDSLKTPIWIEYEGSKGILRLDRDTLTVCFGTANERPTRFDLVEDEVADQYLERIVLKRFKPKDGDRSPTRVEPPQSLGQLQGTWTCVGILGGQSFLEEFTGEVPDIKIIGDTAISLRKTGEKRTKCKISVDDTKQPMQIDITNSRLFSKTAGLEFSPTPMKGVFRIDEDTLTICATHREYPTNFDLQTTQVPYVFKKKP